MTVENKFLLDEQLCFSIYQAGKEFNRLYASALKPFNLTYPQYITLLALWEEPEQTVSSLGTVLSLDSGTLTPMLKRMETVGYVRRLRKNPDERFVHIELTEKAIEEKEAILLAVSDCLSSLLYSQAEYQQLLTDLKNLTTQLQGGNSHGKII